MFKKAAKLKLRFQTNVGLLSVEQLWELNLTQLSNLAKSVKKILKKSDDDELSFLDDAKDVDVENQLRFDLVKEIYLDKKRELEALRDAAEAKKHNAKIDELIAKKQDQNLESKTIEELEALRK